MEKYDTNFEKLENSSVGLTLTFPSATLDGVYRPALEKYAKQLTIKGFRKGKAPVSVIENKYGETILGEAFGDLLEDTLKEIFTPEDGPKKIEKGLRPLDAGGLSLSNEDEVFPLAKGKDIVCKFRYDVYPQFEIGPCKGLKVEFFYADYDPKVEDEHIEGIRQRLAVIIEKKDGTAEEGDIATIDLAEIDDDGNEVEGSKKEDFVFTLARNGSAPYELDQHIKGMKTGDEKAVKVQYGEKSAFPNAVKTWRVVLKKLKIRDVPELDDDFAQDADEKYKTFSDMKEDVHKTLFASYEEGRDLHKVGAALDLIASRTKIDVPETMARNAAYERWMDFVYQMGGSSRASFEDMEKRLADMGITFESYASRLLEGDGRNQLLGAVRRSLVLAKLVADENLGQTTDDDLKKYIQDKKLEIDPEAKDFEDEKPRLKDEVTNERARRYLLENNEFILTPPPAEPASEPEPAPAAESTPESASEPEPAPAAESTPESTPAPTPESAPAPAPAAELESTPAAESKAELEAAPNQAEGPAQAAEDAKGDA